MPVALIFEDGLRVSIAEHDKPTTCFLPLNRRFLRSPVSDKERHLSTFNLPARQDGLCRLRLPGIRRLLASSGRNHMHNVPGWLLIRNKRIWALLLVLAASVAVAQKGASDPGGSQEWAKLNDDVAPRATNQRMVIGSTRRPVDCSIVQWTNTPTVPVLKMSCPPEQVFAPVHVYLEFSWETTDQTPADSQSYVAIPKTPSRVLASDRGILVWLRKLDGHGEWVRFTSIKRIALLTDP